MHDYESVLHRRRQDERQSKQHRPARPVAKPRAQTNKRPRPLWAWAVGGGAMLALAVFILVHVADTLSQARTASDQRTTATAVGLNANRQSHPAAQPAKPSLPPKHKSRFSFYSKLPKYQAVKVAIHNATLPNSGRKGVRYYVQVAAFKKHVKAEHLSQRLTRMGMKSGIKAHKARSGTWYEVRIGPESMARVKATLKEVSAQHLNGLVVKANGS